MKNDLSPCIEVCLVDCDLGICTGCYRTLDEISGWGNYLYEEKKEILSVLGRRKDEYEGGK